MIINGISIGIKDIHKKIGLTKKNSNSREHNLFFNSQAISNTKNAKSTFSKLGFRSKHTRRLYMIRHGQYEDGEKDADRCLSVKGRQQAKLCGEFLKSHVFNKEDKQPTTFVHSTMLRATETAQIINEVLQVPCKVEVQFCAILNSLILYCSHVI